ncbi:MAG: hypothetical protein ABJZ55_25730 [Fuerstiella sp.]
MRSFLLTIAAMSSLFISVGCTTTSVSHQNQANCTPENGARYGHPNCNHPNCSCSHSGQECERADDFSAFAVPVKPGHYVDGWNNAMRCSAKSQQFVISRNSWFNNSADLGPEASDSIAYFANALTNGDNHLLIEKEPVQPAYHETLAIANSRTQQLNDQRRSTVVAALQAAGVSDANSRVHLNSVEELGIRGIEAPQVFNRLFSGGNRGGGGGGGGQGGIGGGGGGIGGGGGF